MFPSVHRPLRWIVLGILTATGSASAELYHHWCARHFSPAQLAAGMGSPQRDVDRDGTDNVIEYLGDTDPWDANSRLVIERGDADQTIDFTMALDREDVVYTVVVSSDLRAWVEDARHLCAGQRVTWHLAGFPYARIGVKRRPGFILDSDQDGLDDYFEEAIVAATGADAFVDIGDVLPDDDFNGDGVPNISEPANAPEAPNRTSATPLPLIEASTLNCALANIPPGNPRSLQVHTPLR